METKRQIIIYVVVLAVAFAAGRYSVPKSVKTETQVTHTDTQTDHKTEDDSLNKHTKTVIVDKTSPDGTKTHVVTRETDMNSDKKTDDTQTSAHTDTKTETKEVTRSSSRLTVSALAGAKISSFSSSMVELDYGAMVSKDLLGPVSIGAFGFKSGNVGVAIGLSF